MLMLTEHHNAGSKALETFESKLSWIWVQLWLVKLCIA